MDARKAWFCGVPLITIHGDMDHASVRGLTPLMLEGLAPSGARLVFDLTDCPYLDSSGIGLFLGLLFEVAETGWLGVVGANEPLCRVFDLTGLSSRRNFHTWADLEQLRVALEEGVAETRSSWEPRDPRPVGRRAQTSARADCWVPGA
jgi:anti-sigma B factor antagonist